MSGQAMESLRELAPPVALHERQALKDLAQGHVEQTLAGLESARVLARLERVDATFSQDDEVLEAAALHVERVCRDPHTLLTTTIELEPVHRVRRVAPAAITYLAAHTEDWLHRGVTSVRPRRVLAERRDTVLDIYENRLVARLLDRVLARVVARMHALEALHQLLDDLGAAQTSAARGWHRRAERVCALWGGAAFDAQGEAVARETLARLTRTRQRLGAASTSELYAAISPHAGIGGAPQLTNVLRSDRRYRDVLEDWNKLGGDDAEPVDTSRADYDVFARIIVARALQQLAFSCGPDGVVRHASGTTLSACIAEGRVELFDGKALRARLLTCPAGIDAVDLRHVEALEADVPEGERALTVLLYLETEARVASAPDIYVGLTQDRARPGLRLGLLPISPWDIGSVERVARALRWLLLRGPMVTYPPPLGREPSGLTVSAGDLERQNGTLIASRLVMSSLDEQVGHLAKSIERAEGDLANARLKRERDRGGKREADEVRKAKQQLAEKKTTHDAARAWRDEARTALALVSWARACPACSTAGRTRHVDAQDYGLECTSCGTRWGVRRCTRCDEPLPFIEPEIDVDLSRPIDIQLGQDTMMAFYPRGSSTCLPCHKTLVSAQFE